jgi:hypothetical protein
MQSNERAKCLKQCNKIKETKKTQCFSFEVVMLVHVIADNETTARTQLDDKGGIVTKRDVKLVNSQTLYGEEKE